MSRKWGPINDVKKEARIDRGKYRCAACNKAVGPTKVIKGKRVKNIFVDHIDPVVDPKEGFTDWNTYVDRLFCEQDNLQLLCKSCHDKKSERERKER